MKTTMSTAGCTAIEFTLSERMVVYRHNGKLVIKRFSPEMMELFVKILDAFPEEETDET